MTIWGRGLGCTMDEEDPNKDLEALKNDAQQHRREMEKAWAQAGTMAAIENINMENLAKKAERKKTKARKPDNHQGTQH